jgi:hypothetical protein
MGWSGSAPALPASQTGNGIEDKGACHVPDTQQQDRRDRHRYRKELGSSSGRSGSATRLFRESGRMRALTSMMVRSNNELQSETGYIDARPLPPDRRNLLAPHGRTIHSGQSRTLGAVCGMSELPSIADIGRTCTKVREVPDSDIQHHRLALGL